VRDLLLGLSPGAAAEQKTAFEVAVDTRNKDRMAFKPVAELVLLGRKRPSR
jgi:hypothetical protein